MTSAAGASRVLLRPVRNVSGNAGKAAELGRKDFVIADRVYEQLNDPRMGQLAGKLDNQRLQNLANNPNAMRILDTRSGHINIIQEIDGKLFRITVPANEMKIISVGPICSNQVTNLINKGQFIPLK